MMKIVFTVIGFFMIIHVYPKEGLSSEQDGGSLTQTIRGRVLDNVTELPLIGATVVLVGTDPVKGTITDENGYFELNEVPVGRQGVKISYIGYNDALIRNLLLVSGKETSIQVKLQEKVIEVDEVSVRASTRKDKTANEMAMVSARSFTIEETERFAGSLGDPARMVANYAGVMTQNDSRNDIIIRGNSPIGVLWRLEGIEIPNPNHFGALGTTGGPVSMLNNNLLTNSDFMTGAFPAEYGNAVAGAFDLHMRAGNKFQREYTGQIGFNGFELGAEGPFAVIEGKPKGSYLVNYRYSTLDVLHKIGFDFGTGQAVPQYQDITFNVDIPAGKMGRFKLIGLGGKSYIELGREDEEDAGTSYNAKSTLTDFGSDLGVLGLTHTIYITEKSRFKTTVSGQRTYNNTKLDSLRRATGITTPFYRSDLTEDKLSFTTQFRQKVSAKDNFDIGLILDKYFVDYADSVFNTDDNTFRTITQTTGDFMLYRAFAQWRHNFTDELSLYGGLHTQYFSLNDEISLEPRISASWQFAPRHSFNIGYGKHSQTQPRTVYFNQSYDKSTNTYFETNNDLKFTKSDHYVFGYNYLINSNLRLRVETYFQDLYNIPVTPNLVEFSMINAGDFFAIPSIDSLLNEGTGQNYGLEITFEKFLSKGYYFLLTASIFDSRYKGYDRIERNTAFNGNYVFNALGGYEFKIGENAMLTLDLKGVLAGGKRYIPIDLDESIAEGSTERDWSRAFEDRYDDYFRTDLRIGIKVNKEKFSQEWGIDFQNISGYQSIFMEEFDPDENEIYKVYQQGFYPMFLYRIQF